MQFSLNDKVHGFRVDRITDLCDIKAMGYEMTHEKVGPVFFMWLLTMTTKSLPLGFGRPVGMIPVWPI